MEQWMEWNDPEEENPGQEENAAMEPVMDPVSWDSGADPLPQDPEEAPENAKDPETRQKRGGVLPMVLVGLCASLIGGVIGAGSMMLAGGQLGLDTNISYVLQGRREYATLEVVEIDSSTLMTPAQVYAANVNSTVGITTTVTTNFWGYQSTSAASGSGFILTEDGYILTNHHVIEDSDSITVSLYNGEIYQATLIGYDESNDLAVLKVEAEGLVPVVLGDSDRLNVGDSVVAIGNPLGELTFSLTAGAISAKDREITLSSTVTMNLLQTDCAINSGNSGGALFNLYGEVVGVTNAKYSSTSSGEASIDNIGFAIPINSIRNIVESIIEKGYLSKPYVGLTLSDVSKQTQQFGVPAGAAVQEVGEDSPAEKAGLQKGDVITAVNGQAMTSTELINFISGSNIGDTVVMSVYRQGTMLEITVTVGEKIQSVQSGNSGQQSGQSNQGNYPEGGSEGS